MTILPNGHSPKRLFYQIAILPNGHSTKWFSPKCPAPVMRSDFGHIDLIFIKLSLIPQSVYTSTNIAENYFYNGPENKSNQTFMVYRPQWSTRPLDHEMNRSVGPVLVILP